MPVLKSANLVLRFLLELCALVALGYWGFQSGRGILLRFVWGLGAPLLAALVWGTFVSPRAAIPLALPRRLLVELLVFGSATAGLAAAGQRTLAGIFALAVVVNEILLYVWGQ